MCRQFCCAELWLFGWYRLLQTKVAGWKKWKCWGGQEHAAPPTRPPPHTPATHHTALAPRLYVIIHPLPVGAGREGSLPAASTKAQRASPKLSAARLRSQSQQPQPRAPASLSAKHGARTHTSLLKRDSQKGQPPQPRSQGAPPRPSCLVLDAIVEEAAPRGRANPSSRRTSPTRL